MLKLIPTLTRVLTCRLNEGQRQGEQRDRVYVVNARCCGDQHWNTLRRSELSLLQVEHSRNDNRRRNGSDGEAKGPLLSDRLNDHLIQASGKVYAMAAPHFRIWFANGCRRRTILYVKFGISSLASPAVGRDSPIICLQFAM